MNKKKISSRGSPMARWIRQRPNPDRNAHIAGEIRCGGGRGVLAAEREEHW